jgi:hypothetical protein
MIELHALIASEKQKRQNETQRIENALLKLDQTPPNYVVVAIPAGPT